MCGKQVLLVFLGIVVVLAVVYLSIPNPGKKALVREQIALNDGDVPISVDAPAADSTNGSSIP